MLILVNFLAMSLSYWTSKLLLKNFIHNHFEGESFYKVLKKTGEKNSFKMAFIIRMMGIAATYKNFLSGVTGIEYGAFTFWIFFGFSLQLNIDLAIGRSLKNLDSLNEFYLLNHPMIIFGLIYILLTIIFTIYIFYKFGKIISKYSQDDKILISELPLNEESSENSQESDFTKKIEYN